MDTNASQPSISQLRARQTELVLALANETRTDRLQQYSDELEFLVNHIQEREDAEAAAGTTAGQSPAGAGTPQGDGVEQREDGIVIEPDTELADNVDTDNR